VNRFQTLKLGYEWLSTDGVSGIQENVFETILPWEAVFLLSILAQYVRFVITYASIWNARDRHCVSITLLVRCGRTKSLTDLS
jgi:hypothetical protein